MALYVREGSEKEQCCLLTLHWLSFISPATHKQIGPFWCWFPGGWACVHSGTLWVSPMTFPVRLGVFSAAATPTDFYSQRFLRLYFPALEHWIARSVSLLICSSQLICTQMWDCLVHQLLPCCTSSPPQLPVSAPPTSLDECFFFNFLVVGLYYSSIF